MMNETATRDEAGSIRATVQQTVIRVWQTHIGEFSPGRCWAPSVNIYSRDKELDICVDLAGLDRNAIDVRVEPGRLTIRGRRRPPEPALEKAEVVHLLAMEIDHGAFSRDIALPADIDLAKVTSSYDRGLLWIKLPRRAMA